MALPVIGAEVALQVKTRAEMLALAALLDEACRKHRPELEAILPEASRYIELSDRVTAMIVADLRRWAVEG